MKKIASIDIGSQTIRLLVADYNPAHGLIPIHKERHVVRLGQGMNDNKNLQPDSIVRAVSCISKLVLKAREFNVDEIIAIATACVRKAQNARQFLETVRLQCGVRPAVISGSEEARLCLVGAQSVCESTDGMLLLVDIGGGSTELILTRNKSIAMSESLALGVIGLAEKHLIHDPPLCVEIQFLQEDVLSKFESGSDIRRNIVALKSSAPLLVGTAGTITTLAAMDLKLRDYQPGKINGHILKLKNIKSLFDKMTALPSKERILLPGLEQGRAIVIIPGTVIVLTIMQSFKCSAIVVSDAGLLEGVILDQAR